MGTLIRLIFGLAIGLIIGFLVASWWSDPPRSVRSGALPVELVQANT